MSAINFIQVFFKCTYTYIGLATGKAFSLQK